MEHQDEELHDDDKPVGHLLSRREMLQLLGGTGAVLITGWGVPRLVNAQSATPTALPACVVRPELTEGPYFVDNQLERFDIRIDPTDESVKPGTPLRLVYRVSDVTGGVCAPLAGAQVDVWQCDADGVYTGVQDPNFDTSGEMWLRGYQITDEDGMAEFLTIVPGWYSGRAVHIHFKIRTKTEPGESYEYTSQFFFDPDLIEEIYAAEPYAGNGLPDMPNDRDFIFRDSEGQLTLGLTVLEAEELDELEIESGYRAIFDVGLDLSDADVGAGDGFGAGRGGRGG
ncbi:MAG: intradiol ring-cleavage dioxygenase [Chloroflexota bacterium]